VGYVFPPGGKAGTTVNVRLAGQDWTPDVQFLLHDSRAKLEILTPPGEVLMPEPPYWYGIKSMANDPPLPREVGARLVLPAELPVGPLRWRVVNASGASNCGIFIVSRDNEVLEQENRKEPQVLAALPVNVSGRIGRIEEIDRYCFTADKSGPVTCELTARRLGSDFHGVLEIHDQEGRLLAESVDTQGHDPVLTFYADKGKSYSIAVRDIDHRGYRSYTYRLSLTAGPRVLAALPVSGRRGEKRVVEFFGIGVASGQPKLESVTKEVTFPADAQHAFAYRLETPWGSAPEFLLGVSDVPELLEPQAVDASARRLTIPSALTGRLLERDSVDRYTIDAKKGDSFHLTAEANRFGSSLDLMLAVIGPEGKELANSDDRPGSTDPSLVVKIPADGVYQVVVSDMSGTAGTPTSVYRLAVEVTEPDFRLEAAPVANIPIGEDAKLIVKVLREGGLKEPIKLNVSGLPEGVSVPADLLVPAAAVSFVVPLTCTKEAPVSSGFVQITGTAKIGDKDVTRTVRAPVAGSLAQRDPELSQVNNILMATTLKPPFKLKCVEADGGRRVNRGATHLAELAIERNEGFTGEVVLDMAATQSRHRQGIRGPRLTVPPGVDKVLYPVFLPELLETTRTSRIAVVAMTRIPDGRGTPRWVLAPMQGQVTMSIEGALLKLSHAASELRVQAGQTVNVPFKLARSANFQQPAKLELVVPEPLAGLVKAEAVNLTAKQDAVDFAIATTVDPRLFGSWTFTVRASAVRDNHPVVSEVEFEVEFVGNATP